MAGAVIMSNFKMLSNQEAFFSVMINPIAFSIEVFSGSVEQSTDTILSTNFTYSWAKLPIGLIQDHTGKKWVLTIEAKKDIRPVFCVDKQGKPHIKKPHDPGFNTNDYTTILQAGPTLIFNSKIITHLTPIQEQFRDDAIRVTDQCAIGITEHGKVIFCYSKKKSILDIATYLKSKGCVSAMKLDGGHKTSFVFNSQSGKTRKHNIQKCAAGLAFKIKVKE